MWIATLLPIWNIIKKVAILTIPIPVFVIVIIGVWFHFDKQSTVKKALAELIASAELQAKDAVIASKEAQIKFIQQANVRQAKRLSTELQANMHFQAQLNEINSNSLELKDKLNAIASSGKCDIIDDDFFKLLQSDQ